MLPLLLVLLSGSVVAGPNPLYARVDHLISAYYLHPEEVDTVAALELAAEAAEDAVPWLMVEREGDALRFLHGESGAFSELALTGLDLVDGLSRVEAAVRAGPGELPEDIELPVELLRGVTRALDRHSTLLYKGRLERFDERVQGTFAGVGARIGPEDEQLMVREVFPDSPAAKGGLMDGDRIVEIDGFSTVGLDTDQAVRRIRGPEGSEVVLRVERRDADGALQLVDVRITRGIIRIPNVTWTKLDSGVLHIEIENFSKQTRSFLEQAVADLDGVRGIALDLRGNTGGSLSQACATVDLFMGEGVIVRTAGRGGEPIRGLMESCESGPDHSAGALPMVVLVDDDSASASEIVAGALQVAGRAPLLGRRTYGKGTVQKAFTVRGGSAEDKVQLKLTEAEYLVGGTRRIEYGQGLEPDVEVGAVFFNAGGAWLPAKAEVDFILVDERPGWRAQDVQRGDPTLALAERALLAAEGADREATLRAFDAVEGSAKQAQDALLIETFALRSVDWAPAPSSGPAPTVRLRWPGPEALSAGGTVTVALELTNTGAEDLHRAYVRVDTDDARSPWGGRTFAFGHVPAGEARVAEINVTLAPRTWPREDRLQLTLHADGRPAVALPERSQQVQPVAPAQLAVDASVRRQGGAHVVALELHNLGDAPLGEISAWLAMSEDAVVELLAREATLEGLEPGASGHALIPVQLPNGISVVEGLELRVDVSGRGQPLRAPLSLSPGAAPLRLQAPSAVIDMPVTADAGPITARVHAQDDVRIEHIAAWYDGEQVAWRAGSGATLDFELQLQVEPGAHSFWVEVVDDQGVRVVEGHRLQGPPASEARAEM